MINLLLIVMGSAAAWAVAMAAIFVLYHIPLRTAGWPTAFGWLGTAFAAIVLGSMPAYHRQQLDPTVLMLVCTLAMVCWLHIEALVAHATRPVKKRRAWPWLVGLGLLAGGTANAPAMDVARTEGAVHLILDTQEMAACNAGGGCTLVPKSDLQKALLGAYEAGAKDQKARCSREI